MFSNFFIDIQLSDILLASKDTLYMLILSTFFSSIIGIPLGILLFLARNNLIFYGKFIYIFLSFIINVLRSTPFIILLIVLIPFTTFLVGTSLGVKGVIPPLVIGAFPFFARLIENALEGVDNGILDMAKSFGANTWQIIWHIILPEIVPNIIASITLTAVTLVSYTAMAGVIGGGGLGDLAIRYGYQRFEIGIMIITLILLIFMVQLIQIIGNLLVKKIKK